MSQITKEIVIKALSTVDDPDLKRDLVSLNMVKEITIDGTKITAQVELTTPACPLKDLIRNNCISAIKRDIPEATEVFIDLTANVNAHTNKSKDAILPGVKNTIAVASGKGGVGKSTVAANLAIALAKDGAKVGIIDADIYGPSMPLMFGLNKKNGLHQDPETKKLAPLESYGIKIISIGFMIDDENPVIWRGPMASGALKQFMTDVNWGDLDYLIYDLPPGTGDIQLTLVQTIPLTGAVIVTTPQEVSLIDAKKGLKMFERVNVPVFGIIENMSYFIAPDTGNKYDIFGSGGGEKLAIELDSKLLGQIPIDPRIREGGDNGKPIVESLPGSENSKIIIEIARNLAAQISIKNVNDKLNEVEIQL
jgi:ATP-binding protein involved in chromosome partitioning